jgi:hypothetical protein
VNTDTAPPAGHHAESRFEDRLLTAILADFDHLAAAPASSSRRPAGEVRQFGRRPGLPRRAAPALIAGAAAVAVTVTVTVTGVTVFASHAPGSSNRAASDGRTRASAQHPRPNTQPRTQPQIHTAAYVVRHMKAALAANTAVLVTLDHAPDSQTGKPVIDKIWSSSTSNTTRIENLDPAGNPIDAYVVTTHPHTTVSIQISYHSRTWSKTVYPFGPTPRDSGPAPLAATPAQQADQLRAEVTAGQVTVVGPAVIDGQPAIELRQGSIAAGLLDMWVSPATYLPIRVIGTAAGTSPSSDQAIRDDYQWLPGTPANLHLLTAAAAIPAGFTRVASHEGGAAHSR